MNFLLHRTFFKFSQATSPQYVIFKKKFLLPAKPKKPSTPFLLFSNEKRPQITGKLMEISAKLGAEWKAMTEEQKKKYQEQFAKSYESYSKQISQYHQKYQKPFKNLTAINLAMKKCLDKVEGLKFGETGSILSNYLKNQTEQQKKQLEEEASKIKSENEKEQKKFLIPQLQFKTERSFMMGNLKDKKISELTQQQRKQMSKRYQEYLENHKKEMTKFAQSFNITYDQLIKIIKLFERRQKRAKALKNAEQQTPSAPKNAEQQTPSAPKKTVVKKNKTTSSAKRVKKSETAVTKKATKTAKKSTEKTPKQTKTEKNAEVSGESK